MSNKELLLSVVTKDNVKYLSRKINTLSQYIFNSDDSFWGTVEDEHENTAYERIMLLDNIISYMEHQDMFVPRTIEYLIHFEQIEMNIIKLILEDQFKEVKTKNYTQLLTAYEVLLRNNCGLVLGARKED